MDFKQLRLVRAGMAFLIGGLLAFSIIRQNYLLALVAVGLTVVILVIVRRRVKEVVEDERDFAAAGKAARTALAIFNSAACLVAFTLLYWRGANPNFELIGSVLAYSVCVLLVIYNVSFQFFDNDSTTVRRIFYTVLAVVLGLVFIVGGLRVLSGEDDWICQNGEWVQHGHPSAPVPVDPCK